MTKTPSQRGSLKLYHGRAGDLWRARFRVPAANGKRREIAFVLGRASDMTEGEARRKLDAIVDRVNSQTKFVRDFALRGIIKKFIRPANAPDGAAVKVGNMRGNVGAASELIVCADLVSKGVETYRAVNPQGPCDVLCMVGDTPMRVEVKTETRPGAGIVGLNLKDREGAFDILALVHRDGAVTYYPHDSIERRFRSAMGLHESADRADDCAAGRVSAQLHEVCK